MRFILPNACRLVGVPDASQTIPPGHLVAIVDGQPLLPPIPPWKPHNALLYRDPGEDRSLFNQGCMIMQILFIGFFTIEIYQSTV